MAFVATKLEQEGHSGNLHIVVGTFTNDTSSGTASTGLINCMGAIITGGSATAISGGTVTFTTAATSGYWIAWGY